MTRQDPSVLFVGDDTAGMAVAALELACRFYGFRFARGSSPAAGLAKLAGGSGSEAAPVLLVVAGSALARHPAAAWRELQAWADAAGVAIAVVGIAPDCDRETLSQFIPGATLQIVVVGSHAALWINADQSDCVGFELRGLRLGLGPEPACGLEHPGGPACRVLAKVGPSQAESRPALLRFARQGSARYLLTELSASSGASSPPSAFWPGAPFAQIAPMLLLLRDAGGIRCWQAPALLANLTIDDPWLIEPYGRLSYPGLLAEMRRERFHATIGYVPWNFDRSSPEVVALVRDNPKYFSVAVHGNNHDRYEFFRYESRAGDRQRAKPLAVQAFNIRQALARMESFHRGTGLDFDPVMVFPHGVCPASTFGLLKQNGFWATSNYSNVPLGECPPADPAVALRAVNAEWEGFPALRRNYPQNLSEEAIAIDLFLGNPVLFMAHQDLFFDGIGAFTPHARRVNLRQPAVRWMDLGEITRNLHLVRWPSESGCDVRLVSRHARIENPRPTPVDYHFAKREPDPQTVQRVTVGGAEVPWTFADGEVRFSTQLGSGVSSLIKVHYRLPAHSAEISLRRSGFRNHCLRLIAEFRDLTLSRSVAGRLLTRKYYRPGKPRPTLSGLFSR